jgi:hypothetical protein
MASGYIDEFIDIAGAHDVGCESFDARFARQIDDA